MDGSALKVSSTRRHRDALDGSPPGDAENVVTGLYELHAVGFIRLAVIMLGDRAAAPSTSSWG